MAAPLTYLQQRANDPWLLGLDAQRLAAQAEACFQQQRIWREQRVSVDRPFTLLLAEADPLMFLAHFIAACTANHAIFLGNPHWGNAEWQQALQIAQPDRIIGHSLPSLPSPSPSSVSLPAPLVPLPAPLVPLPGWIMIPTGGSSGRVRFAIHTWDTLTASVEACRQYFQVDRLHSCCILPLYHVSGLMQFLRSLLSGGKLAVLSAKTLNAKPCPIDPSEFFLSLVPTQLQRWLQMPAQATWLSRFHTVLLGGGPAWSDLLQTARHHQIRLAPTYGMTETASQIVTLKPDDFLQGKPGCGQALPHAQIQIRNEAGQVLAPRQVGAIAIQATSLALGYYPELFAQSEFQTDDLGFLDDQGYLHVVGRRSQKIITGGENVFPAEVEAVIRASQLVDDVCVLGIPDAEWGEAVTAVYVPSHSQASQDKLRAIVEQQLSRYKRPKRWIPVQTLPRNAQGKVNYAEVKRWLQDRVQG